MLKKALAKLARLKLLLWKLDQHADHLDEKFFAVQRELREQRPC